MTFVFPFLLFFVGVYLLFRRGVRARVYSNFIRLDRKLEFAEKLDVDLDDISKYPRAVLEILEEKQKYDAFIAKKDEKITKTEKVFHEYVG